MTITDRINPVHNTSVNNCQLKCINLACKITTVVFVWNNKQTELTYTVRVQPSKKICRPVFLFYSLHLCTLHAPYKKPYDANNCSKSLYDSMNGAMLVIQSCSRSTYSKPKQSMCPCTITVPFLYFWLLKKIFKEFQECGTFHKNFTSVFFSKFLLYLRCVDILLRF